ncbi:hypothetical protein Noda2021_01090 [Candidatus Dependentiae bacterium Noda2021]|nr:hypothetical protein Noda2021_01090 [Candidatus Dependentiae bacterium Noda2021]
MIEAIPPSETWSVGSLVEYTLVKSNQNKLFLHNVDLIDVPFKLAREDILFFHHILELSYFFMLEGSHVPGMYELLQYLYSQSQEKYSLDFKLLFLFKFFVLLGRYPEDEKFQTMYFEELASKPIDTVVHHLIPSNVSLQLSEWIISCVMDHPYVQGLKTIHFLERDRLL